MRQHMRVMAAESPEGAARRIKRREVGEQANREMMARFAPLTPENAHEAAVWQSGRIEELMQQEATK